MSSVPEPLSPSPEPACPACQPPSICSKHRPGPALSPSPEIRLHFAYDEEDMQSLKQECLDMYQAGNHTIKWTPEEAFEYAQKNPSGLIEWLFDGLRSYRSQARAGQATTQSPEIRYQLRNWHHVTCLVAGGACTCLAQREALIAELALKER